MQEDKQILHRMIASVPWHQTVLNFFMHPISPRYDCSQIFVGLSNIFDLFHPSEGSEYQAHDGCHRRQRGSWWQISTNQGFHTSTAYPWPTSIPSSPSLALPTNFPFAEHGTVTGLQAGIWRIWWFGRLQGQDIFLFHKTSCGTKQASCSAENGYFNPLALELDIYSLAHHLCKMWIFCEPRSATLGNTRHFVEE